MDSRVGYSHAYKFTAAKLDEINSRQKAYRVYGRQRLLIFEMRVEFIIDADDSRQTLASESYDLGGLAVGCGAQDVGDVIKWRLDEYWMSESGMDRFCEEAAAFGNLQAAEEEHASEICVPVIVQMEVVTVQRQYDHEHEHEPLEYTMMRTVLPQKMTPLHVWHVQTVARIDLSYKLMDFLFFLPRARAGAGEGVDGWCCRGCHSWLDAAFIGAFTTVLECGCGYHSHCLMRKLERNNVCHACGSKVYDAAYLTAPPLEEWWWEDADLLSYGLRSY